MSTDAGQVSTRPYLIDVAASLGPAGSSIAVQRGRSAAPGETFVAVPTAAAPRLLLPDGRRPAAGAIRAYGGHGALTGRVRTALVGALFASGLGHLVFRDRVRIGSLSAGLVDELATVVGTPVRVALRAGPPRANRKPVLAVLDPRGRVLAFAKLADNPVARALVDTEATALARLAELPLDTVQVPRLLHRGTWQGMPLLVQSALPVARARAVPADRLIRAVEEIATSGGTWSAPWRASPHADHVRRRLAQLPPSPEADAVARAVDRLADDDLELPLGSWHGDWTPWNCAAVEGSVLVWDWERFDTGVPVGLDLLHHDLQSGLALESARRTCERLVADAPGRLAALGIPPSQADRIATAYLIELASRYLADDQKGAGRRIGDIGRWLLPVLEPAARGLTTTRGEGTS